MDKLDIMTIFGMVFIAVGVVANRLSPNKNTDMICWAIANIWIVGAIIVGTIQGG